MNGKIFAWLMVLLAAFDSPGRAQDEAQRVNVCGKDAARAAGLNKNEVAEQVDGNGAAQPEPEETTEKKSRKKSKE